MTDQQKRDLLKTVLVIAFGLATAFAEFGPLAQYKDYILLIGTCISVVAAAFGINLQSPAAQVRSIKATRAESRMMKSDIHRIMKID